MDSKILDKAIISTQNTVNAMIKELAAGPGKARFHAETFVHACNALNELNEIKKETRAPKKKVAVKQD
jgi:hypothetical protein